MILYIRAKIKNGHYLHMCSISDMSISETVLVYFVDFMFLLYWVGTVMTRNTQYSFLVVILVFFPLHIIVSNLLLGSLCKNKILKQS